MKLFRFFRRRAHEREMDAEMRFHIEMETVDLERQGLSSVEARRRALATFGGVQRYKEEGHESRGTSWLDDLTRDIRYSVRSLLRSPGYTTIVVLTLALGIAANTSILSVANGILFKPLPYRDPAKLMLIWDGLDAIGVPEAWVTGPEVVRLREETKSFTGFAVVRGGSVTVGASAASEPQQVPQAAVSANFFEILGAGPELGRGFSSGEDAPGSPRLAVTSHRLWTQHFGADSAVVGRTMFVDGNSVTIIGVLPRTFAFSPQNSLGSASGSADVYLTFADTLAKLPPSNHSLGVLARVRPDVSMAAALADLDNVGRRLDAEVYQKRGFKFKPVIFQERMVREVRPGLLALLGAVAVLLLIMAANLAVLALVRAARREREVTVRRAIGASHGRVARQIFTETVVLALAGGAVGSLLGVWALKGLLAIAPPGLPRRTEIGIDLVVLAVTLGVALVVGIALGLAPVFRSLRSDISTVLREKAPSHAGGRLRRGLVSAQLALSMILLAATGLLLGSFVRLIRVDAGFNPDRVFVVEIMASRVKYPSGRPVFDAFERFTEALRNIPGVVAVGAASAAPLSASADQYGAWFPGSPTNTGDNQKDRLLVDGAPITPGYMKAMGIVLLEGQEFDASHRDSSTRKVAIIDDLLAKRFFPQGNALGQYVALDGDSLRIIGVSRHVKLYGLNDVGREQLWVPHSYVTYRFMSLAVRTSGDIEQALAAARPAIRSVDRDQPIMRIVPMSEIMQESLAERRLILTLVGGFAAAALLLAALGVYGVTASSVTQRTREIGIRMALGANQKSVVWSVLTEPARLVMVGLVIGVVGTMAAGRVVERLLYGVRPTDPVTLVAVAVVLLVVALLASYLPARRATRVDPIFALRGD